MTVQVRQKARTQFQMLVRIEIRLVVLTPAWTAQTRSTVYGSTLLRGRTRSRSDSATLHVVVQTATDVGSAEVREV